MGAVLVDTAEESFALEVVLAAIDNNGVVQERTKSYGFDPIVTTHAGAVTATVAFLPILAAIEEADIVRYTIRTMYVTATGPVASVGNVRKEAVLTLRHATIANKKLSHIIISPYDAMISGNSVVITAALQTYLDQFETGAPFTISDGEHISTSEATRVAKSRVRTVGGRLS